MAIREASFLGHHSTLPAGGRVPCVCQESGPPEPPKPRLLDRVRHAIQTRHYSRGTERAYVHWTKRYIFFHGKRHPAEMGAGPDYHAPGTDQISRGGAPYIITLRLVGVLTGGGRMSVHRLRRIHSP
jgi:integrase-like protein